MKCEMNVYNMVCLGTLFTFLMTVLGAATVFLFRGELKVSVQKLFFGFAAGVMIAASIWSLLLPAMEAAEKQGMPPWFPAGGGFILGGLFLWLMDEIVRKWKPAKMSHGSFLLFSAVTMHNIPEGMAVGLAFAAVGGLGGLASGGEIGSVMSGVNLTGVETVAGGLENLSAYASAIGLAVGIGIQNFPEGAAISLPLRREGVSKTKAFLYGSLTGVVEPLFGIPVVLVAGKVEPLMPWLLSFAAGAMIYVTVDELIPQASEDGRKSAGTFGAMTGFLIMMLLDVALG